MANIVPGVTWKPINYSGNPKRRKGRGACAHVAVSNSAALAPSGGNSWHFYLPKVGPAIQYVDLDYVAYAQLNGNPTLVSWESQGGVTNADGEPWTANQVEWGARIMAHLNATEGVPLQVMPNSMPGARGLGYHRLGVDPWRVAGGELWSSSRGKICPGAAKIAQIPQIVDRARQIVGGAAAPARKDTFVGLEFESLQQFETVVNRAVLCKTPSDKSGAWAWDRIDGMDGKTGVIVYMLQQLLAESDRDDKAINDAIRSMVAAGVAEGVAAAQDVDDKRTDAEIVQAVVAKLQS